MDPPHCTCLSSCLSAATLLPLPSQFVFSVASVEAALRAAVARAEAEAAAAAQGSGGAAAAAVLPPEAILCDGVLQFLANETLLYASGDDWQHLRTVVVPRAPPPHVLVPRLNDAMHLAQAFLAVGYVGGARSGLGTWPLLPPGPLRLAPLLRSLLTLGSGVAALNLVESCVRIVFMVGGGRMEFYMTSSVRLLCAALAFLHLSPEMPPALLLLIPGRWPWGIIPRPASSPRSWRRPKCVREGGREGKGGRGVFVPHRSLASSRDSESARFGPCGFSNFHT